MSMLGTSGLSVIKHFSMSFVIILKNHVIKTLFFSSMNTEIVVEIFITVKSGLIFLKFWSTSFILNQNAIFIERRSY